MAEFGSVTKYQGSTTGLALNREASQSSTPSGPAGGDLTGSYPNPQLIDVGGATGTFGDSTNVAQVTIDSKGRTLNVANVPIAFPSAAFYGAIGTNMPQIFITGTPAELAWTTTSSSNITITSGSSFAPTVTGSYLVSISMRVSNYTTNQVVILEAKVNGVVQATQITQVLNTGITPQMTAIFNLECSASLPMTFEISGSPDGAYVGAQTDSTSSISIVRIF